MKRNFNKNTILKYINDSKLSEFINSGNVEFFELHIFKPGEVIYHTESKVKYFYFLLKGKALVCPLSYGGKEVFMEFMLPIDILGDIEYFTNTPIYHNVEAITEVYLLGISIDMMDELKENIDFYKYLCELLCLKLSKSSRRNAESLLYSAKSQICNYLYHKTSEGYSEIQISIIKTSRQFGISERHLRRILDELRDAQIIERFRGQINVLNHEKLKKLIR